MKPNFYEILGVTINATKDEVKRAYIKNARVLHPDMRSGPHSASQKKSNHDAFVLLNEAYETLKNDKSRKEYTDSLYKHINSNSTYGSSSFTGSATGSKFYQPYRDEYYDFAQHKKNVQNSSNQYANRNSNDYSKEFYEEYERIRREKELRNSEVRGPRILNSVRDALHARGWHTAARFITWRKRRPFFWVPLFRMITSTFVSLFFFLYFIQLTKPWGNDHLKNSYVVYDRYGRAYLVLANGDRMRIPRYDADRS